jgi:hypothetical protein
LGLKSVTSCIRRENSSRVGIGRSICIVVATGVGLAARLSCCAWRVASAPACASARYTRCSGIPARFRCGCGREVAAGERGRCWWCVLAGLVTDALAGPGGQVPTQLRPLAGGLASMHRPQSGVVWLRRSAITREALRDLARDRMPYSHTAPG